MKRKQIIVTGILCVCVAVGAGFAYSSMQKAKGADEFNSVGAETKSAAETLLANEKIEKEGLNISLLGNDPETIVAEVMGTKVSKDYFDFKFASYKANPIEYENPKEEAWQAIKKQVWEENFARENNILPTQSDIEAYVTEVKNGYQSSEEGKALLQSLCDGMGMTEDEYWGFHRKYHAPQAVISGNVQHYLEENNLEAPSPDEIEGEILDKQYFDELK